MKKNQSSLFPVRWKGKFSINIYLYTSLKILKNTTYFCFLEQHCQRETRARIHVKPIEVYSILIISIPVEKAFRGNFLFRYETTFVDNFSHFRGVDMTRFCVLIFPGPKRIFSSWKIATDTVYQSRTFPIRYVSDFLAAFTEHFSISHNFSYLHPSYYSDHPV